MTQHDSQRAGDPRILDTIRRDIQDGDLLGRARREFRELAEFFIDEEKRKTLATMGAVKRWLVSTWWTIKGMFLRLTPIRRLLVFFGAIVILVGNSVQIEGENVRSSNWEIFGGIAIFAVLMLEVKDRVLAREELEAGRMVQRAFMPPRSPSVAGWSLWLFTRPANEVGGDLVDYMTVKEECQAIIVADVAGKGLRAALLMANLQATMRALAPDYDSLAKLVGKVNEIFHRNTLPNVFASFLSVEFSPSVGELRYVNAGHFPPILVKGNTLEHLPKGEPALGLMAGSAYTEHRVTLEVGEFMVIYSDGLTEARNTAGEFYGIDRLVALLPSVRGRDAAGIGEAVMAAVDRFVGEAPASDDISIVVLQRA